MTVLSMQMRQKIRIKVSPQFKGIYDALKAHAVGDFHELFFICACLGKKESQLAQLTKSVDCFWSSTIFPHEWYAYYAIYLSDNDMDLSLLGDDEKVIALAQDYANGGMSCLIEEFLCDYAKKDSAGNYLVDHTDQLPRELLMKIAVDWS